MSHMKYIQRSSNHSPKRTALTHQMYLAYNCSIRIVSIRDADRWIQSKDFRKTRYMAVHSFIHKITFADQIWEHDLLVGR